MMEFADLPPKNRDEEPKTGRDPERRERLCGDLRDSGLDAVIAALPENVLLLTGYFPVVGTSVALATRDGEIYLLAPHDERELAEAGGADQVIVFKPASLRPGHHRGRRRSPAARANS